jgi:hypothetical protein
MCLPYIIPNSPSWIVRFYKEEQTIAYAYVAEEMPLPKLKVAIEFFI